jgi:hypothetical protein
MAYLLKIGLFLTLGIPGGDDHHLLSGRERISSHFWFIFKGLNGQFFALAVLSFKGGVVDVALVAPADFLHTVPVGIKRREQSGFVVGSAAFFKPRFKVFKRCLNCFIELKNKQFKMEITI